MKFRIHYTLPDGTEDYIDVEKDTIEEIREEADEIILRRGALDFWSEEL